MDINKAKQQVILAGKALMECGLIVRTWGNVSCRIDKDTFVITPSGRTYDSLTPDDVVLCRVEDASYDGNVKPSSEKGAHAIVYRMFEDANFVIHTHQVQASAISGVGIKSMPTKGFSMLGDTVPISKYGLPSTKKLANGIAKALKSTDSHAVIMTNHGALCYGKDYDEAFLAANQLEEASSKYVEGIFKKQSKKAYSKEALYNLYQTKLLNNNAKPINKPIKIYNSKRTKDGFILVKGKDIEIPYQFYDINMPVEALIHSAIYKNNDNINFVKQVTKYGLLAISNSRLPLRPLLDDFAQIVGRLAHCAKSAKPKDIVRALKSCSGILVPGAGALCCAATESDAHAVELVMEKNALAEIVAKLLDGGKYIGLFDSVLMHYIYTHKYSKKATNLSDNV